MRLFIRRVSDVGLNAQLGLTATLEMKVKMGILPMQHGYSTSLDRLVSAASGDDSAANDVYVALFEVSNWLASIADRAGEQFKLNPIQRGIRFARNATHHAWASVVEYAADRGIWVWRQTELLPIDVPDVEGRADHMQQLAGRPVADGFLDLKPAVMGLPPNL